jgi:hypothetical protein
MEDSNHIRTVSDITLTSLTKLESSYATSEGYETALQSRTAERALSPIIDPYYLLPCPLLSLDCSEKGLNAAHGWHTLK